jgi:hypothetical protein
LCFFFCPQKAALPPMSDDDSTRSDEPMLRNQDEEEEEDGLTSGWCFPSCVSSLAGLLNSLLCFALFFFCHSFLLASNVCLCGHRGTRSSYSSTGAIGFSSTANIVFIRLLLIITDLGFGNNIVLSSSSSRSRLIIISIGHPYAPATRTLLGR